MSNYCSKLEIQDDDDYDRYEDIIQEYDDCSYSPELSQSYIAESKARTAMKENSAKYHNYHRQNHFYKKPQG